MELWRDMFRMRFYFLFFCHREAEDPIPISKASRSKPELRKALSTSSISNEVTSSSLIAVEDIDKDDKGDPFLLPEYVNDIYAYLREVEVRTRFWIHKRNIVLSEQFIIQFEREVLYSWEAKTCSAS
jgi:hypothetical protein